MDEAEARKKIAELGLQMLEDGLTTGTGGNISYRLPNEDYILISPSGIPYGEINPEDIPLVNMKGSSPRRTPAEPSSELPLHLKLYKGKERIKSIVHTHSPFASAIAAMGKSIPPIYYLIAFVGAEVPLAEYATFGTERIGESALAALGEGNGVLLEKHGSLAVGNSLDHAYRVASLIEELAKIYYRTMSAGAVPEPLEEAEIEKLQEKFQDYGEL
mgnify:CR=1 FL=1